ncbi:hypothetical protein GE09DRAFT_457494 [Coniochaeta sp. 2T2.1]|nr:hypothetical protein GE09DRAFT_457494 [Coniochaeta sp. 2T2.1]
MALTVKHLNDDASFLLSFAPVFEAPGAGVNVEPFRILLDPWITGPSTILHPKMSVTHQKHQACISSLKELPEPDIVIISQHIPDHCNEATLRQLPPSGTKTIILAEPTSARLIRSWKYFDKKKVQTIPKWDDWSATKEDNIIRIPLKPIVQGGEPGEVTVAFIPQRKDMMGLHSAVGITYRPPTTSALDAGPLPSPYTPWTPPASPRPRKSFTNLFSPSSNNLPTPDLSPEPTPTSPGVFSLRSVRSASSIPLSISSYFTTSTAATSIPSSPFSPLSPSSPPSSSSSSSSVQPTTLSVLFSPHGISYQSLQGYISFHLSPRSALPLTALLHCFDNITNPWWLGGEILLGAPVGAVTAAKTRASAWISAHDGEKEVKGLVNGLLKTRKWSREEVEREVGFEVGLGEDGGEKGKTWEGDGEGKTEVIVLGIGEEVVLGREGVMSRGRGEKGRREMETGFVTEKGRSRVKKTSIVVTPPG